MNDVAFVTTWPLLATALLAVATGGAAGAARSGSASLRRSLLREA
jgi:hypothetical protein